MFQSLSLADKKTLSIIEKNLGEKLDRRRKLEARSLLVRIKNFMLPTSNF